MERKGRVNMPNLGEIDATILDINSSQETWNQYLLSDGTVLKLKVVVTEAIRADGHYDNNGEPLYAVKSSNILSAIVPENLKRKGV